ncbi:hypothetical protein FD754_019616, partial [Muntiacus muntjak]
VSSIHPECRFHLEIQEEEMRCAELLRTQTEKHKEVKAGMMHSGPGYRLLFVNSEGSGITPRS